MLVFDYDFGLEHRVLAVLVVVVDFVLFLFCLFLLFLLFVVVVVWCISSCLRQRHRHHGVGGQRRTVDMCSGGACGGFDGCGGGGGGRGGGGGSCSAGGCAVWSRSMVAVASVIVQSSGASIRSCCAGSKQRAAGRR